MIKRLGRIGWAYVLALLPLCLGSAAFFYWYFQRRCNAIDAKIEGFALLCIGLYFVLGLVTLILCLLSADKHRWYRVLGPLAIVGATWLIIDIYDTLFFSDDRAYVGVDVRDPDIVDVRLWSSHFEQGTEMIPRKEKLVFIFRPVYTFHWEDYSSSFGYSHQVDSVFIEIIEKDVTRTLVLPDVLKGECLTLTQDDLDQLPVARNRVRADERQTVF